MNFAYFRNKEKPLKKWYKLKKEVDIIGDSLFFFKSKCFLEMMWKLINLGVMWVKETSCEDFSRQGPR